MMFETIQINRYIQVHGDVFSLCRLEITVLLRTLIFELSIETQMENLSR